MTQRQGSFFIVLLRLILINLEDHKSLVLGFLLRVELVTEEVSMSEKLIPLTPEGIYLPFTKN